VCLEQLEIRASTRDQDQTKSYRSFVQSDGYFEFNEIPAGDYSLSIPSVAIEPALGAPRALPQDFAIAKLGIDLVTSVAQGENHDLGIVEGKTLPLR